MAGVDTLYVADDVLGLLKYSLVGGSWLANGRIIITGGVRGLTATVNGTSVTLYATGALDPNNELLTKTDSTGYNGTLSGGLSPLARAGVNKRFTGVALAPVALCTPGSFSATGNLPCSNAQPGFYVPTSGAVTQTACSPGSFQANTGAISCNTAQPGNFVSGSAAIAQPRCAVGQYQPGTGQMSCIPASAGNFVAALGASSQTQCATGSYQPGTAQSACIAAQAGFYVPVTGAIAQTPCPLDMSSAAGAAVCFGLPLLNIDNSAGSVYDAATDGVLLLRYLFGLRGSALISNARGAGPSLRRSRRIWQRISHDSMSMATGKPTQPPTG